MIVPLAGEIGSALLDPAGEIGGGDFVGRVQGRVIGGEECHHGVGIGDAEVIVVGQLQRVASQREG